jgi:hypothetical protein
MLTSALLLFRCFLCRLCLYASVSQTHLKAGDKFGALNAKEWNDHVIAKLGRGKGGGKPDSAQVNVPCTPAEVEALKATALAAAQEFVDSKKL